MKKLFLLFLALPIYAANYAFLHYENNYTVALERALKEKKLLMLVIVEDHCGWCQKLAHKTLLDTKVQQKIQTSFVPLLLNSDHDPIPKNYRCVYVPAIYFIDPVDDEEIYRGKGYHSAVQFLKLLHKALESHQADLADEQE